MTHGEANGPFSGRACIVASTLAKENRKEAATRCKKNFPFCVGIFLTSGRKGRREAEGLMPKAYGTNLQQIIKGFSRGRNKLHRVQNNTFAGVESINKVGTRIASTPREGASRLATAAYSRCIPL
ncbi:hypothetical protein F4827_000689 [Paraburkholderia bannensis]|uniref:Uncharacterized protein n=1 Tax=Paraburkholderia bannensis TaxID=765414 RepID=A0A7W9TSU5_9BURK|nr:MULTISPECIES: hypothetical protein [Paraburkholderia]MBB3255863.1 hypothetical protein [Paraburkholderia sp. WP4_3_2]MBB6100863.1 hypothetical protein [Paraburkholderia bannensis]